MVSLGACTYVPLQVQAHLPPGISLVRAEDFKEWLMDIRVLDENPIYMNQTYRLKFKFGNNYPIGATVSFPTTNNLTESSHRSTRSDLRPSSRTNRAELPPHSRSPTYLLEWDHLPRSAGIGLVSSAECGERMYKHPEHVDWEYKE